MKYWLISLMIVTLLALPATAQNIGFLSKGPISYLNDAEKALLSATLNRALENSADGESVVWNSPTSDNNGRIQIIDTHEDYGTTCRTIRAHTMAAGREGGGIYRLCRADDNTWRFAPRRRNKQS